MEVAYRREMNRNYMVVRPEQVGSEKYTIRMLSGNRIQGLLPFQDKMVDGEMRYYYDITSKQPLNRLLEHRNMTGQELRTLLTELLFALRQMERFLLDEGQLCVQPEYIYVEPGSFKTSFCLVPGVHKEFSDEFCELSQYVLDHVSHSDGDAVVLAFSVFKECRKLNFGIEDIERCLRQQDVEWGRDGNAWKNTMAEHDEAERKDSKSGKDNCGSGKWNRKSDNNGFGSNWKERTNDISKKKTDGEKSVEKDDTEWEIPLRYLLSIGIGLGMIAIPIILYFMLGFSWLYRWKWIVIISEIIALIVMIVIVKIKPTASDAKEKVTENHRSNAKLKQPSKRGWNLIDDWDEDYDQDDEPWEVYFREEKESEELADETMYESRKNVSRDDEDENEIQTVLLTAKPIYKECRKLVPVNDGPEISVGYFPFIIGKNKDLTDYCLSRPGVSRLHVKLEETTTGYTVTDLNSTNGTMVNGVLLEANGVSALEVGDELVIGAERFYFR